MAGSALFGTDGVRGRANDELTAELAMAVAAAAVRVLSSGLRPRVVIGMDTRPSSPMLAAAVAAGVASAGGDAVLLGVVPTALVAFAARSANLGIMITASHNPAPDNGIKIIGPGGRKLTDSEESAVEAALGQPWERPVGLDVGSVVTCDGSDEAAYEKSLVSSLPHRLTGLRVVVDCANGAASGIAPRVYRAAGATVTAIHAFDGLINDDCGATHLDSLREAVVAAGADVGIAHDGDADRCLLIDATGATVDGDQILGILGAGRPAIVTTVMANLALHQAMEAVGTKVVTTAVGDRCVLDAMQAEGITVGGEQSGHIILLEHATTGDGILTALQVLSRMVAAGTGLAQLADVVRPLPQVLVNVPAERSRASDPAVLAAVLQVEARLGTQGRVLVRASGTEPLVRVMVEAPTSEAAATEAETIAVVLRGTAPGPN